jgi:hypothetical protein
LKTSAVLGFLFSRFGASWQRLESGGFVGWSATSTPQNKAKTLATITQLYRTAFRDIALRLHLSIVANAPGVAVIFARAFRGTRIFSKLLIVRGCASLGRMATTQWPKLLCAGILADGDRRPEGVLGGRRVLRRGRVSAVLVRNFPPKPAENRVNPHPSLCGHPLTLPAANRDTRVRADTAQSEDDAGAFGSVLCRSRGFCPSSRFVSHATTLRRLSLLLLLSFSCCCCARCIERPHRGPQRRGQGRPCAAPRASPQGRAPAAAGARRGSLPGE